MERIKEAVSDSGPLIHLAQIGCFDILGVIKRIYISPEVFNEVSSFDLLGSKEIRKSRIIKVKNLEPRSKDFAKLVSSEYSLGLGEAESLALAKHLGIKIFLTDDMAARILAKRFGLEPHGTIGVVLKACKRDFVKKDRSIQVIKDLHKNSSLFLTSDLVNHVIKEIKKVRKKN